MSETFRVGTRGSALATTQTGWAAKRLAQSSGLEVETILVKTEGDVITGPLSQLGGTGVFAAALRQHLLDSGCDLAVHSLKDLPTKQPEGLVLAAIPEREDVRDALCARDGLKLSELPEGQKSVLGHHAVRPSSWLSVKTSKSLIFVATSPPDLVGSRGSEIPMMMAV